MEREDLLDEGVTAECAQEVVDAMLDGDFTTIVDWIERNLAPDKVFASSRLEEWARANGFGKVE